MHIPYLAVLFDLDGTLLENDMDAFLPPYFQMLSSRFSHLLPPEKFLRDLMEATNVMMANDGRKTNEEVFAEAFYPMVGLPREELEPIFYAFYANDFDRLQRYTQRRPEALAAVQTAFDHGLDVVVATNPLFPAIAIGKRLEWAGVADFPYRLITTYENSRACKPNLLYFQHILEEINRAPQECLVVGDEAMDMVAGHLGCDTFLIPGPRTDLDEDTPEPTYRGTLGEVFLFLED
jgi:FMN phosphatase YigB (HAD superfamily)